MLNPIRTGFVAFSAAVALLISATARPADLTAALDAVPADAEVVIVIPSLQDASDALAELTALMGVDDPDMADPLGAFKRDMNFEAGLDDDGPAVIVLRDVAAAIQNQTDPTPIMLMPVSDYGAFVGQLEGTADGVTEIQMGYDRGHAREVDGYAVMAEEAESVQAYAPGKNGDQLLERVGRYGQDASDEALVAVYVDVQALAPVLKDLIDQGVAEFKASHARAQERGDMAMNPMANAIDMPGIVTAYGDLGKTLLDSVDVLMATASHDANGVTADYAVQLNEGSTLAGYLTGEQAGFDQMLGAMPDQPYIFATAFDMAAVDFPALNRDILTAVKALVGDSPLVSGWLQIAEQSGALYDQMESAGQVFYAPDMAGMMGGGGMFKSLSVYRVDDPDAAIETWKKGVMAMPGLNANLGDQVPGMSFKTQWTDDALTLDGHDVHQYQVNVVLPPELIQQMGPAAMMMGNAGYGGYVTGVDGHVLVTTVPDRQLITNGIAAVKAGDGLGSRTLIQDARDHLPAQPAMEAFLSLDGIATSANPFLMMFAGGQQIAVPADLAPVTMGLGVDERALGFRTHVPTEVITFIRDTAQQMQAATQRNMQQPAPMAF